MMSTSEGKQRPLFVNKKQQKNFIYSAPVARENPGSAVNKVFLRDFLCTKNGYFLALILALALPRLAAADATTEAQLRAALQNSTTQIANLEDQVANLQASEAPDVAMIEALRAQLQTLKKGGGAGAESPASSAKNAARLAALARQLAARNAALDKSQSAYQAEAAANAALQARLAATNAGLASCTVKNAQLFSIGNQILDAYSHKDDVFAGFANHEPFIGFKRVQLQNIVQDDQDKLDADQLNPAASGP